MGNILLEMVLYFLHINFALSFILHGSLLEPVDETSLLLFMRAVFSSSESNFPPFIAMLSCTLNPLSLLLGQLSSGVHTAELWLYIAKCLCQAKSTTAFDCCNII